MKVFFINTNKKWGGGEKWHFDAAKYLQNKGYYVAVLTLNKSELFIRSSAAGIKTVPVKITNTSFLNPFRIFKILRLFIREHPDAVVLNFSADLKTAGVAAKLAHVPKIIYRRGNARPVRNSILNRILYRSVVTGIIANSEETRRAILKNNAELFEPGKIRVIYNGIDVASFTSMEDQHFRPRTSTVIIGSAGRLSAEKGHRYLIETASLLKKNGSDFKILIAGEGPLLDDLVAQVGQEHLAEEVVFTGFQKDIKTFLSTIDIFILPSLWEGFGYATVEAMASGKPVVAFSVGSNPEIIADNETGFLIRPFDIAEMAGRIKLLIDQPELRSSFGMAGRRRADTLFNIHRSEQELEAYLVSK